MCNVCWTTISHASMCAVYGQMDLKHLLSSVNVPLSTIKKAFSAYSYLLERDKSIRLQLFLCIYLLIQQYISTHIWLIQGKRQYYFKIFLTSPDHHQIISESATKQFYEAGIY